MISHNRKIAIDRFFGAIAVAVIKKMARVAGVILRRDHSIPACPGVIAVSKMLGLGSIVYTGILCRALKERFPKTTILYITSRGSAPLVKRMNYIDKILVIDDSNLISLIGSTAMLLLKLWKYRPVLYFDMEVYSNWSAVIATLSLALNRYGYYRKSSEFKKGLHTETIFFNAQKHISEVYDQMALIVSARSRADLSGILKIFDKDKKICSGILNRLNIPHSPVIIINPNASDLLIERRWPAERWVEYLNKIVFDLPDNIFLITGAQGDIGHVASIHARLSDNARERVFNVAGKFSLGQFLALVERCVLIVTNDSGPLHFAVALNRPTVSIWGPGDPGHYAPIKGINKIIYKSVYCSPCLHHTEFPPCHGNNICVKEISVDNVLEATKEAIRENP